MAIRNKEDLIAYALANARSNPDTAENVLEFFCDAVERGEIPKGPILEYLAKCFRQIVSGDEPAVALNLARAKGKRRLRTLERIDERNIGLACAVVRRMNAGEKRDDAIENVAANEGSSSAVVKRAYEAYRQLVTDTDQA